MAGIVDEDVEAAEIGCRRADHPAARLNVAHVERIGVRPAPGCRDHPAGLLERFSVAGRDGEFGAGGGQRLGNGPANAAACARDDGLAAGQTEQPRRIHGSLSTIGREHEASGQNSFRDFGLRAGRRQVHRCAASFRPDR
ncbi:MAG: hypothetical protein K0S21_1424 [Rhizobiaceae bacterium]|nr:hypothetical protein [Rhizobiaceae bacterium]